MTDRNQSGVDWEDDEFLFAVEGLDEDDGREARPAAGARPTPQRPPEAGLTAFFGSTRGASPEADDDPLAREEASLSGLMGSGDAEALGADELMQELRVRPEEQLRGHFGGAEHPLAYDDAWEGAPEEQPRSLEASFHAAAASEEIEAQDGSDGWGFESEESAAETEEETFAFVDREEPSHSSKIDHGFQVGVERQAFPSADRLRTEPLGVVANPAGDGLLDEDFAGDDSEVVSWNDSGADHRGQDDEEHADFAAAAEEDTEGALAARGEYDAEAALDGEAFGEQAELHHDLGGGARAPRPAGAPRTRRLLLVGSGLLAAALAALAVPYALEYLSAQDAAPAGPPTAAARSAKAPAKAPKVQPVEVAAGPGTAAATPATQPEIPAGTPDTAPPTVAEEGAPTEVATAPAEVTPQPPAEAPGLAIGTPVGEELPAIGNLPEGSIGRVDIGSELALAGEVVPEASGALGEGETSEAFTPGEDRPIPATAWADMGGAVPAGDTILRQSKVRVQLRNGAEFDGQLRKIDDTMIELKLEQGTVVFVYEDLREILPLEAAGTRLSEYPEGYVEFRSQARIWGRIVADLPTHVTLAFGPAHLSIPKRAVKLVHEQPMSTILLGNGKSSS